MGFLPSSLCFLTVSAASAQTYWTVTLFFTSPPMTNVSGNPPECFRCLTGTNRKRIRQERTGTWLWKVGNGGKWTKGGRFAASACHLSDQRPVCACLRGQSGKNNRSAACLLIWEQDKRLSKDACLEKVTRICENAHAKNKEIYLLMPPICRKKETDLLRAWDFLFADSYFDGMIAACLWWTGIFGKHSIS